MADRKEAILARMRSEGQKVVEYFGSLQPQDWETPVYTTGGRWRVREVLCHFVSAERTFVHFGRQILGGGEGTPEGFRIDEFNEAQVGGMAERLPAGLIAEFAARRAETIDFVEGMREHDFQRVGRHPWFGNAPLGDMLKLVYRHTMLHLRDVRQALERRVER